MPTTTKQPLPSIIPAHPAPFGQPDPRYLTKDVTERALNTLAGIERALDTPGTKKNPTTCRHMAEHIVGLHAQLVAGTVQFTRRTLDVLAPDRKQGRPTRVRAAKALLKAQLERVYDKLEPFAE